MAGPMPSAPQGAAPKAPQAGGSATDLVANIHSEMTKLMDIMQATPAVGDDDKAKLASVIQGYQQFVQGLSEAPGAAKPAAPQAPAPTGPMPMEAGMRGKPMMMQG